MVTLIVRHLDADLVRRLEERAAANGRSAEAESRFILKQTLRPAQTGHDLSESLARGERTEIEPACSPLAESPPRSFLDLLSPGEELKPARATALIKPE
jgi:plasmid stability protein